jgi:hypothetical protein
MVRAVRFRRARPLPTVDKKFARAGNSELFRVPCSIADFKRKEAPTKVSA